MAIEFGCPGCHETLRVPDTAAGKVAKCPSCSTMTTVPDSSIIASHDAAFASSDKSAQSNPFADAANPYGGESIQPYQVGGAPLNPYASPGGGFDAPWQGRFADAKVGNQQITVSAILNEATSLWQNQLGLLIGMTLVLLVIVGGLEMVGQALLQELFVMGPALFEWVSSIVVRSVILVVATFLHVGQIQMTLKICRREPVMFADLFNGGGQFVAALMAVLLVTIPYEVLSFSARLTFGFIGLNPYDATIASAWLLGLVSLIFNLLYWPYIYLVIDEKASVLESFGMAYRVTEGNRATSFLMWLCGGLIMVVGALACLVGIVAAAPLAMMMMPAVAYLMMSGQLPPEGYLRQKSYKAL